MELKGPDFSRNCLENYTKDNYKSFKIRLARALAQDGVSSEMLMDNEHSGLRQYIINFVQDKIINNKKKDALQGITYKLMDTTIEGESTGVSTTRTYPVINKYQGHLIEETIYFQLCPDNLVKTCSIPYVEQNIIIL